VLTGDGSRGTLAIWIVAAMLGGIALVRLAGPDGGGGQGSAIRIEGGGDGSVQGAAGGAGASDGSDGQTAAGADRGGASIYVHVAGAVRRPGLVQVPDGSRVAVALERAGGPRRRAELSGVNLAARLEDGQQVIVPVRGAAAGAVAAVPAAPGGPADAAPGSAGVPKLSLAAASVEQLDELDGIGPTLAQRIVEYRTKEGGFRSIAELQEVEGIGEKRFATLREALQP
jgi:competence protein ComEA